MRPVSRFLLAALLSLASFQAVAQEPGELNKKLGAFDPQCLDLYDALDLCAEIEQEEIPCDQIRSEGDVPFNNVWGLLADWPERYSDMGKWFDYCRAACQGKARVEIAEFADKVCHTKLTKR